MTRNKLTDLNNHMFEQLERLNDDDISYEELDKEIKRAKAMSGIASNIISNAALALEAQQYLGKNKQYYSDCIEVVGNIYENKELLEDGNVRN